jgi:hypothetical protein
MSRDLMDENYYVSHGGKIPVKWSAPEVRLAIVHAVKFNNNWGCITTGSPLQEVLYS